MIEQITPSIISLIIGSLLTLVVTYFTQTMNRKGEKNKVTREKLEESYILLGELKYWLKIQYNRIYRDGETDINDEYKKKFESDFWWLNELLVIDFDHIKCECPIERFVMLVSLYAPSLKNTTINYKQGVDTLKFALIHLFDPDLLKILSDIKALPNNKEFSESIDHLHGPMIKGAYISLLKCEELHNTLQASLEKTIIKI
jgi:hypothetical protein